jgi:hypothetical protein
MIDAALPRRQQTAPVDRSASRIQSPRATHFRLHRNRRIVMHRCTVAMGNGPKSHARAAFLAAAISSTPPAPSILERLRVPAIYLQVPRPQPPLDLSSDVIRYHVTARSAAQRPLGRVCDDVHPRLRRNR